MPSLGITLAQSTLNPCWISAGIALFSLCLSLYTLWRTRIHLTVSFDPILLSPKAIFSTKNGQPKKSPSQILTNGDLICTFSVINPTGNDIAYFGLDVLGISLGPPKAEETIGFCLDAHPDWRRFYLLEEQNTAYECPIHRMERHGVFPKQSFR